ncbi:transmembrane protein 223 [Diachasma alloeum]|uniref:transmembrane protein 223 n=1 Tax=Diachasma alloeum TaxID=454923 RepID=UPI0007384E85|nr:transmembrane protein 223 [Diachasma alloeum]
MLVNLLRITSSLRSNLLQRLPESKEKVRCYGLFRSWGLESRCQESRSKLKFSSRKSSTPKFIRTFTDEPVTRINTNVANNVILWKFEHPKYFLRMTIFNATQFTIMMMASCVAWTFIPIFRDDMTWKDYAKKAYLSVILCFFTAFAAISTGVLIWMYTCRSLKYIILNKGGTSATLVTYHPIKGSASKVVPLEDILIKSDRNDVGHFISLKLRGTGMYHLIDKDGIFVNPDLYDLTVALDRTPKIKKKNPDSLRA